MDVETKRERAVETNNLLMVIASCGRKFFAHQDRVARFEVDDRGRIWYVDQYTQRRIYTHYNGRWRGFTNGGTMRALVERLRDFIASGKQLPVGIFGPWPEWVCGGDLWGYGSDMVAVQGCARRLGLLTESEVSERTRLIREQQRSGGGKVTAIMVSRD